MLAVNICVLIGFTLRTLQAPPDLLPAHQEIVALDKRSQCLPLFRM